MSTPQLLLLGAAAGLTILLGLSVGRLQDPAPKLRAFLAAGAIGVLLYLFVDLMARGNEAIEGAVKEASEGKQGWTHFAGLSVVFLLGLAAGLFTPVLYERWIRNRTEAHSEGPGAAAISELTNQLERLPPPHRLAFVISVGIGLHNLGEGLIIGQSAAKGQISLALLLIFAFALHNAMEGLGIAAPLAAEDTRPSWPFIALLGAIAGGPVFVGTLVGQSFTNDLVFLAFLALAAGSILYVIVELFALTYELGNKQLVAGAVFLGLILGSVTNYVLTATVGG